MVPGAVLILAIEFTDAMCTWKRELDDEKIENLKLNNVISSQSKNDAGGNEKIMDSLYLENKLLKDSIDL
ncbi:MAG: hypothetical protein IPF93_13175 [Saprospiraceae bacterium]|nr:hypothetical protein [Saprospiraceae bacterium]